MHWSEREIYSPESTDGRPRWKEWRENAMIGGAILAVFVIAIWALWSLVTHLWILPIILVPLIIWMGLGAVRSG